MPRRAPRTDPRARALLALAFLALLPGAAEAVQTAATVRDAAPVILSVDLRAGSCGPPGVAPAMDAPRGPLVCVHARDDNGARDLCEGPAHARLDALLASGQAWSRPLACVHAEGRDAWMAADAPPGALRLARVHVEDAWGAAADADLLLDAATATPPVRHPTTAPSRRAADLLP